MNNARSHKQQAASDLERVIEPLASYICAAEQPKAALRLALTVLCSEVQRTNRAAYARVAALAASRWS